MKTIYAALAVSFVCVNSWAIPIYDAANGHYYDVVAGLDVPWLTAEQQALTSY